MRRTGLFAALVMMMSLIAAPALADGAPDATGNLLPPHLEDGRVFLLPCPVSISLGPEEPFHIRHGFGVQPGVEHNIGEYRFELAVNGEIQPYQLYNIVNHGDETPPSVTRFFVTEFPEGLSDGDVVEGSWYDPDGFVESVYCMTTVTIEG